MHETCPKHLGKILTRPVRLQLFHHKSKKTNLSTWICALYVTAVTASVCRSVLLVFVFLRTHQPSHLPQPSHVINKSGDNKEVSCSVWLRLWLQRAHSSTPADLNNDEELEYSGSVVRGSSSAYGLFSSVFPTARKKEARFTLLKREGNDLVKQGNFEAALHKYSECLALKPEECALYTNRCGAFKDARAPIPNTGRSV